MLNRRHFRVKVMQTIYAMQQQGSDSLEKEEKFLFHSIDASLDLYLLILAIFPELKNKEKEYLELAAQKHLATREERNPNLKFVNNLVFQSLSDNYKLSDLLEVRKINNWKNNDDMILYFNEEIKKSDLYKNYMKNNNNDFNEDLKFVISIFEEIIAPCEKLYSYLEDFKLSWVDDIPVINTYIVKQLKALKPDGFLAMPKVIKNDDDREFIRQIFRKTVLNEQELAKAFEDKTPNWDKERIAELDTILLKMAICELTKFPSIPVKVTMNEYLEIAKEYSTAKSSIFINGILDNIVKEYTESNKINKIGRGLL